MNCENCGNENVKIINTVRNTYVCEKCGRDTESLLEIKLYKKIRNKTIEEFSRKVKALLPVAYWNDNPKIGYKADAMEKALFELRGKIDEIAEQMKEVRK